MNVFSNIERSFLPTGFCWVNIRQAAKEVGMLGMHFKRLFRDGAVKVWDTRITEDGEHFEWYKRKTAQDELLESGDSIIFGKYRYIIVKERADFRYNTMKLYWWLRIWLERVTGN